jgi:hypothetical protein
VVRVAELVSTAHRGAQPGVALIEIEIRVVDPFGTMQVSGHLDESSTEWRNEVEAILHELSHLAERVPVGRRRRVEDARHPDLQGSRRRVEVYERSIHTVESLHGISKRRREEEEQARRIARGSARTVDPGRQKTARS